MQITFLVPMILSFFVTLFTVPLWIKRAKKVGLIGRDLQKKSKEEVAESGGTAVLTGFLLGVLIFVALETFLYNSQENFTEIFALLNVIILASLIGFVDDIFGWKIGLNKKTRIFLIIFASIPLIAINAGKSQMTLPLLGIIDFGLFYPLLLIPLGVAGATTTFNFLAGYNGLEAGNGILILSAIAIVSALTGNFWLAIINFCMVMSLLGFLFYNFYPAKVFPGDSLTYGVGALIAITAILGNFEKIAVFFFIPYIIETVMKLRGKLKKESFSVIKEDGSLELKHQKLYSLTHLAIFLMQKKGIKPTERKVVLSIWIFQLLVIIIGFIIFREGIFLIR